MLVSPARSTMFISTDLKVKQKWGEHVFVWTCDTKNLVETLRDFSETPPLFSMGSTLANLANWLQEKKFIFEGTDVN